MLASETQTVGRSDDSKTKQSKGQVLKEAFYKGQRTSEREHQSVVWLRADMDDQDKSIICVDTLVCCLAKV